MLIKNTPLTRPTALQATKPQTLPSYAGKMESPDFYVSNRDSVWTHQSGEMAGSTTSKFMLRYTTSKDGPQQVSYSKKVENPDKPLSKKQRIKNGIKGGFRALGESAAAPFLLFGLPVAGLAGLDLGASVGLGAYASLVGVCALLTGGEVADGVRDAYAQKSEKETVSVKGTAAAMGADLVFRPSGSKSLVNLGPDPTGGWIMGDGV